MKRITLIKGDSKKFIEEGSKLIAINLADGWKIEAPKKTTKKKDD